MKQPFITNVQSVTFRNLETGEEYEEYDFTEHTLENNLVGVGFNIYSFCAAQIMHKHCGGEGVVTDGMAKELEQIGLNVSTSNGEWISELFRGAVWAKEIFIFGEAKLVYKFCEDLKKYFDNKKKSAAK
jgi:hypothetical protein